jgi:hypothetical protein
MKPSAEMSQTDFKSNRTAIVPRKDANLISVFFWPHSVQPGVNETGQQAVNAPTMYAPQPCPALRPLKGDVPTKSGADALKLIAVLEAQQRRA